MAKPPEPLDELLPQATSIVLAKVIAILETGPLPKKPEKRHPSEVDLPIKTPRQRVKLAVERVLRGASEAELVVEKPEGAYTLEVGEAGPFFIANGAIIGRYGPRTHSLAKIETALAR